jgi:hypothetical protein
MLKRILLFAQANNLIPAKAEIYLLIRELLDSCLRRSDSLHLWLFIKNSIV